MTNNDDYIKGCPIFYKTCSIEKRCNSYDYAEY